MTSFRIERGPFAVSQIEAWAQLDPRFRNWPVVYALDGDDQIYVGESLNVASRFRQHLSSPEKRLLKGARVVLDPTFNKSVCLDLEAFLIQRLSGDGLYQITNRNVGITDRDYFGREDYQKVFTDIFEELREDGLFSRSLPEIENSDLFKLSPFKALTDDQEVVVLDILEGLFQDIDAGSPSQIVVRGEPGTGKTVVAVYLMKLLSDVKTWDPSEQLESESPLAEFFVEGYPELLRGRRLGFVVPQMSLRKTIQRVFKRTPGLEAAMVMSPFEMGNSSEHFDLLVDEAHRLRQSGNQPAGPLYKMFSEINEKLFGADNPELTQLDWVKAKSAHQIYLLDSAQSIHTGGRPKSLRETAFLAAMKKRSEEHAALAGCVIAGFNAAESWTGNPEGFGENLGAVLGTTAGATSCAAGWKSVCQTDFESTAGFLEKVDTRWRIFSTFGEHLLVFARP
jgi:hypothetical protein